MNLLKHFEDVTRVRRLKMVFYVLLVVTVVADIPIHREHAAFVWEMIPGFSALYGFLSCVLLIVVSKTLGHQWLMKKEDYYD